MVSEQLQAIYSEPQEILETAYIKLTSTHSKAPTAVNWR